MMGTGVALPARGKRHRLLLQQRLAEMLFWPALLIAVACVALLAWGPGGLADRRLPLAVAATAAGSIAVATQWFSLRAYARCQSDGLRLQFPFHRLTIAYRDIQSTRLAELGRQFPPESEPWSRRRFLEPLAGVTLVVVEFRVLPASRRRLQLWMSRYLLDPVVPGLMLPVRDWLGLRSELDEFRARAAKS